MEPARQMIIDLINEVLQGTPPIFIRAKDNQAKARLANQLVLSNYLDGRPLIGNMGQVIEVAILDVTIEGRKYCEELEKEIRESRLSVKTGKTLKKGLLVLLGAIGGVIATVATQWLLAQMNLK